MNPFKPGDEVSTVEDQFSYSFLPAGTHGTVVRASDISHATANGGGYDVSVRLEDWTRTPEGHAAYLAAMERLGVSPEYAREHEDIVNIRSTNLRKEN